MDQQSKKHLDMSKKKKIKQLETDLNSRNQTVKRMHQKFNNILNILFSSMDADEKNKQVGWQVINEKIDDSIN